MTSRSRPAVVRVPGASRITDLPIPVFGAPVKRVAAQKPPKAPPAPVVDDEEDLIDGVTPKQFLEEVMRGKREATSPQIQAAKALMAYYHKKAADEGKKEAARQRAAEATSKFAPPPPPGRPLQ